MKNQAIMTVSDHSKYTTMKISNCQIKVKDCQTLSKDCQTFPSASLHSSYRSAPSQIQHYLLSLNCKAERMSGPVGPVRIGSAVTAVHRHGHALDTFTAQYALGDSTPVAKRKPREMTGGCRRWWFPRNAAIKGASTATFSGFKESSSGEGM